MKNFLKMFFALVLAIFLLGIGYYLVFTNLSYLLATDKPKLQCCWKNSGITLRTGAWIEMIALRAPFRITRETGKLVFGNKNMIITVTTSPKFRIQWKKSLLRRRSIMNGEY